MSIFAEQHLNEKISQYLNNEIRNPILQKVIEEEFIYSNKLEIILKEYLSELTKLDDYDSKLNSLNTLIKNVSKDNYNHLRNELTNGFINLDPDQHIFLIMNMNNNMKNIFEIINNNNTTSNILKNLLAGLSIGINDNYIMKCINSCKIIDKKISDTVVFEYIRNNNLDIVMNDNLLSFFLNYIFESTLNYEMTDSLELIKPSINIKLTSVMENLMNIPLNNMAFAFEIYKLGKIIIDGDLKFNKPYFCSREIFLFSNEQLEYIAKSVHTCIINKNIPQAQTIHAIIYYINENIFAKYMKYYNKFLTLRSKTISGEDILSIEYELWNINKDYKNIMTSTVFSEYKQFINNIKYSIVINNDMKIIKIKNSDIKMNKLTVQLKNNFNHDNENIKHHPSINEYIESLNKYIQIKTPLQKIQHSMNESIIKFKTNMGSINCSLVIGSILLYLQDSPLSISKLMEKTNLSEQEIRNKLDILYLNNIVIMKEDGITYKYVEPFGEVDCTIITMKSKDETNTNIIIGKFTDIVMTIESRIIKEVKPNKMNVMELERRVQEFMGESYVRSIFYQRLDSLKNKYFIKEDDSIIEYIV